MCPKSKAKQQLAENVNKKAKFSFLEPWAA